MKTLKAFGPAIAAGLLTTGAAMAEDDVRLSLNWMYYGCHAGFALGKDAGIYEDAGIDNDIRSGNGPSSARRLVANGDRNVASGPTAATI